MPPSQTFTSQNMPGGITFSSQPSQYNQPSQPLAFPGNNFGQPGQFQQGNFNNYGNPPQQNLYPYAPSSAFNGMQPGGVLGNIPAFNDDEQFSEERKGPRVGLIIGIVLLVV